MSRLASIVVLLLCGGVTCARAAPAIRVFADQECSSTALIGIAPPGPSFVYVMATLDTLEGITGAEFKVVGLPAGWQAFSPNPAANIVLGDPLDATGANIAFPVCQSARCLLLFEIALFPTTIVTDMALHVGARTPPTNLSLNCPLVVLCDAPFFTGLCVSAGSGGGGPPSNPNFPIATRATAWSAVKTLFR